MFVDGIRTKDDLVNCSTGWRRRACPAWPGCGGLVCSRKRAILALRSRSSPAWPWAPIYLEFNRAMKELKETSIVAEMNERFEPTPPGDRFNELLSLPRYYELERRYGVDA
ncbi:MAG: hypothetical protein U0531_07600 [Dehalococcoidia bacterium]